MSLSQDLTALHGVASASVRVPSAPMPVVPVTGFRPDASARRAYLDQIQANNSLHPSNKAPALHNYLEQYILTLERDLARKESQSQADQARIAELENKLNGITHTAVRCVILFYTRLS